MADLVITAANVVPGANAVIEHLTAGVAVTAGQVGYVAGATGKVGLADNNSATAEVRVAKGILLHAAAANQPVAVFKEGDLNMGAILTVGTTYCLGDVPGAICPDADVGSGEYKTILGVAISTSVLRVKLQAAGVAS